MTMPPALGANEGVERAVRASSWPAALARAIALAASLLALACQSFVVQTHVHVAPAVAEAGGVAVHGAPRSDRRQPDGSGSCPVCRELAAAGRYLASSPPPAAIRPESLSFIPASPLFLFASLLFRPAGRRGRGPPAAG